MSETTAADVLVAIRNLLADAEIARWVQDEERVTILSIDAAHGTIRILYRRPEHDFVIGLRVQVESGRPPGDEAARILIGNVNEPLGSFAKTLKTDENGTRWWTGEPSEWWLNRTAQDY